MFLAIDRVSKFTYVEFHDRTKMLNGAAFLQSVIEAFPYRIHTVLTDNGIQFTFPPRYADGPTAQYVTHMFDMRCRGAMLENG